MVSKGGTLKGKVVVITGGGTGLGRAMALAMAGEGADLVVAARRAELIEQTARDAIAAGSSRAIAIPTDVTDSQQVNQLISRTLTEMGRIDVLVNNAGIVRDERRKDLWEITDEEWRRGIDTNLTGTFYCCRAVSKYFVERRQGRIINVASGQGLRGGTKHYMYGSAKSGVMGLTRVLAITWAEYNIQVNAIVPGFIETGKIRPENIGAPTLHPEFIPVGRLGVPQDIGAVGLFLASDASSYVTGALFAVDGGGLAGGVAPTGYALTVPAEEV